MRIVIVAHNLGMGGVERASSTLANSMASLGHEVHFLAIIPKPSFFELEEGISYVEPGGFNKRKLDVLKTVIYIRREVKRIDPDFVICFTKLFYSLANIALLASRYKLLVSERSSPFYKWPWPVEMISQISRFVRKPAAVLSQTSVAASVHQRYYRRSRVFVLPNAIREVASFPTGERKNILLCVGRLGDPCKGFDLMVQAFNLVEHEDWQLHFVGGDRNEGKSLLDLAKDESTKKRIHFHGKVAGPDKLLAEAGIFVMPSRSEGFPNALAEAMATGTPCISFDFIAGARDIISDGVDGILVPPNDTRKLAANIDALIRDEELRNGIAANARVKARRFSRAVVADELDRILKSL